MPRDGETRSLRIIIPHTALATVFIALLLLLLSFFIRLIYFYFMYVCCVADFSCRDATHTIPRIGSLRRQTNAHTPLTSNMVSSEFYWGYLQGFG